ncbi:MAG: peptidoglycan DD-metalloendopeptidase family protein [Rickettsiales bacterium]|nr:peptidoglycan DD-metalloendopeptidase family protein [Rickettsiales bacterium]
MFKFLSAIFLALFVLSCSQEPAKIVYKGHNFYGKNIKDDSIYAKPLAKKLDKQEPIIAEPKKIVENFVKVKPGDSLFLIAKKNKIPLRNLIEANNLQPPYKLYPGDKLIIPSNRNTHIVQYGENVSIIANKYGISSNDISSINNLAKPYIIRPGQILILPYNIVKETDSVKTATASVKNANTNDKKSYKNKNVKFIYPVQGKVIAKFGAINNGVKNDGINFAAKKGKPIKASASGKIVYVGNALKGYGNLIVIKHDNNWLSAYAHNDEVYITKNQQVKQGEVIATVGQSGDVDRPQLYFSLRKGRKAVDPKQYLANF